MCKDKLATLLACLPLTFCSFFHAAHHPLLSYSDLSAVTGESHRTMAMKSTELLGGPGWAACLLWAFSLLLGDSRVLPLWPVVILLHMPPLATSSPLTEPGLYFPGKFEVLCALLFLFCELIILAKFLEKLLQLFYHCFVLQYLNSNIIHVFKMFLKRCVF